MMSRISDIYPGGTVTLRDVSLRDGLQLVREIPSTESKIEWMRREHAAGIRHFELGSFLPASRMPQFADIREMIAGRRNRLRRLRHRRTQQRECPPVARRRHRPDPPHGGLGRRNRTQTADQRRDRHVLRLFHRR